MLLTKKIILALSINLLGVFSSLPLMASERCIASHYSSRDTKWGSITASGARLNGGLFTAAHRTAPFGTILRITLQNKRMGERGIGSILVTVTDRGPYVRGRCVDLSQAARKALRIDGLAPVIVERLQ